MNIRLKLNLILLGLTFLAALVVGSTAYIYSRMVIESETINSLEATLESRISHINHAINLRQEQAKIIAGTYLAKNLKSKGDNDPELIAKLQQHIEFIHADLTQSPGSHEKNIESGIENIGVWDVNGKVIANTNRSLIGIQMPESILNQIKAEEQYFEGYVMDSISNTYYLKNYASIRNHENSEFVGVVVMKLNTRTLETILGDRTGLGETGEILLTQFVGNEIQFIVSPFHAPDLNSTDRGLLTDGSHISAMNHGRGAGLVKNYQGKDVLAAWRRIPDKNWFVSAEIYKSEAFAPVDALRRNSLLGLIVVIFVSFIISHFASKRFSKPLEDMLNTFTDLSKGHTVKPLTTSGRDEIAQLASAANQTIAYLNRIIVHSERLGKGDYSNDIKLSDDADALGQALTQMTTNLRQFDEDHRAKIWLQESLSQVNKSLRGELNADDLSEKVLAVLARITNAKVGVLYEFTEEDALLTHRASYALRSKGKLPKKIKPGEGLIGQALHDKQVIITTNAPADHLKVHSALGESSPNCIICVPLIFRDRVKGVIELGVFHEPTRAELELFENASESIAIALSTAESRKRIQDLLEESQAQTEELGAQQEELQLQTNRLVASEEELRMQQDELLANNRELEEKGLLLREKAEELERISRYKSEFMANMSHELRTPLNSIMLLSKLMSDNPDENLNDEQMDFARIIHQSGNNLLGLINDILDLTKIEAGKMEIHLENVAIEPLCKNLEESFMQLAKEKGLRLSCKRDKNVPEHVISDGLRLEQVMRNIVSNALKFTEQGGVDITVDLLPENENAALGLAPEKMLRFKVKDSGIGIPKEKQELIFEAFQQADGSTRRKYGGTGLGLSISKQLTHLLGGNIFLESTPGTGSTFTLLVPLDSSPFVVEEEPSSDSAPIEDKIATHAPVELKNALSETRFVLVVEDNAQHAKALTQFLSSDFIKCLRVGNAKDAFSLLQKQKIDCMILDMGLPDATGYEVMEELKKHKDFKDLPIIIYTGEGLSTRDEQQLKKYANAIVLKTVNSYKRLQEELFSILDGNQEIKTSYTELDLMDKKLHHKKVLVVDDDVRNIYAITKLLEAQHMQVHSALNGKEALEVLADVPGIEIVLMDIMMPEMDGYEAMGKIRANLITSKIPIIALTAKAMVGDREKCISAGASDYISKPIDSTQLIGLLKIWLHKEEVN